MRQVVADRRILKAFYTQYVAVLLILLVFAVAAFQSPQTPIQTVQALTTTDVPVSIGEMRVLNLFDVGDDTTIQRSGQLDAIAEIVKSHDVRAIFHVRVARQGSEEAWSAFRRALRRADAIRAYMLGRAVMPSAVRAVAEDGEGERELISVKFESEEGPDGT